MSEDTKIKGTSRNLYESPHKQGMAWDITLDWRQRIHEFRETLEKPYVVLSLFIKDTGGLSINMPPDSMIELGQALISAGVELKDAVK